MVAPVQQIFRYGINDADVIEHVDRWWLAFASENNANELDETSVLGHPIWEFIADLPTQRLYREIHHRVRSSGNPIEVPFRCDSPTMRRYMRLTISHSAAGHLRYESQLIRAVPQRQLPLLNPSSKRSDAFLTMCSCCKRSLIEPSGWLEMEDIALRLRMYDQQAVPDLRYTLCPDCSKQLLGK
jgi:hypothetical protein